MRATLVMFALVGCAASPSVPPGELPCGVSAVVCSRCVGCHDTRPQHGAHFSLRTWANVDGQFGSTDHRVWERMQMVIEPGAIPHMPPMTSPDGQPTAAELDTLRAWFEGGAVPAPIGSGCEDCRPPEDASPAD